MRRPLAAATPNGQVVETTLYVFWRHFKYRRTNSIRIVPSIINMRPVVFSVVAVCKAVN
jgi:hypothetical protein